MYFRKNTLKKYDLQESYNNLKTKLKISFCESGPSKYFSLRQNYKQNRRIERWSQLHKRTIVHHCCKLATVKCMSHDFKKQDLVVCVTVIGARLY